MGVIFPVPNINIQINSAVSEASEWYTCIQNAHCCLSLTFLQRPIPIFCLCLPKHFREASSLSQCYSS